MHIYLFINYKSSFGFSIFQFFLDRIKRFCYNFHDCINGHFCARKGIMAEFWYIGRNAFIVLFVMLFFLGIIVGSFLNVLIFRIPLKEDIAVERSDCMHCGHVLSWYELIPLFSWNKVQYLLNLMYHKKDQF